MPYQLQKSPSFPKLPHLSSFFGLIVNPNAHFTSYLISQSLIISCCCSSPSYTSTSSSWFSLVLYLIWFCCWTIKRKRIWCKNNCKWTICTMKNIGSQVYCWSLWNYDRWTLWDPLPVFNRYLKVSLFFKNPPGDPITRLMVPPCYHSPTTP